MGRLLIFEAEFIGRLPMVPPLPMLLFMLVFMFPELLFVLMFDVL